MGTTNKIEFYMNFTDEQMERFKKDKISLDTLYALYADDDLAQEWKPANKGSYKDFAIKGDFDKEITFEETLRGAEDEFGYQADATMDGTIRIRKGGIQGDWQSIIAHEAGHQLSNMSSKLGATIMMNPDDVFGRYNTKQNAFHGIYGEYSPEEAWATAVSVYVRNPSDLRTKYPKAYRAVNAFFKASPSARKYVDRVMNEYRRWVNSNGR